MNKFYVEEGNKRVSDHAGRGRRLYPGYRYPDPSQTDRGKKTNLIYYEFVDFYNVAHTNEIWFSQLGKLPALIQAIGKSPESPGPMSSAGISFPSIIPSPNISWQRAAKSSL